MPASLAGLEAPLSLVSRAHRRSQRIVRILGVPDALSGPSACVRQGLTVGRHSTASTANQVQSWPATCGVRQAVSGLGQRAASRGPPPPSFFPPEQTTEAMAQPARTHQFRTTNRYSSPRLQSQNPIFSTTPLHSRSRRRLLMRPEPHLRRRPPGSTRV